MANLDGGWFDFIYVSQHRPKPRATTNNTLFKDKETKNERATIDES
jgi:hypothetical protein